MSNTNGNLNLVVETVDKGNLSANSLTSILENDNDFLENEDHFREDTLRLGYNNEAERVSEEIYNKHRKVDDEFFRINLMVDDLFKVNNFIGMSSLYGAYEYTITETETQYVISIGYIS